jgi:hypothetical protein
MYKILLLGDSYGAKIPTWNMNFPYKQKAWHQLLKSKYKVTNFCRGASGLDYSYLMLHQKDTDVHKFDKIIFLVSDPRRFYLHPDFHDTVGYPHFNWHAAEPKTKSKDRNHVNKILQEYIKYFMHTDIWTHRYHLMVRDLKVRFHKKILLLKCFDILNTTKVDVFFDNKMPLHGITRHEEQTLDIKDDWKMNHMLVLHHTMLYRKISKWIDSDEFSLTKDDLIKLPKSLESYEEYVYGKKSLT